MTICGERADDGARGPGEETEAFGAIKACGECISGICIVDLSRLLLYCPAQQQQQQPPPVSRLQFAWCCLAYPAAKSGRETGPKWAAGR